MNHLKSVLVDEMCEYETTSNCVVWSVVHWSSLTQWKSISSDESAKIDEVRIVAYIVIFVIISIKF